LPHHLGIDVFEVLVKVHAHQLVAIAEQLAECRVGVDLYAVEV
jgi:hypothetical protein